MLDEWIHAQLRERIEAKLAKFRSSSDADRSRLEKELARLDTEAHRLVLFIRSTDSSSSPGEFDAVRSSLERVSNEQRNVKAALESLAEKNVKPEVPTVDEIMAYVLDVEARIKDDPTTAREALRCVPVDGRITITPEPDGSCRATSALFFRSPCDKSAKAPEGWANRGFGSLGGCRDR